MEEGVAIGEGGESATDGDIHAQGRGVEGGRHEGGGGQELVPFE